MHAFSYIFQNGFESFSEYFMFIVDEFLNLFLIHNENNGNIFYYCFINASPIITSTGMLLNSPINIKSMSYFFNNIIKTSNFNVTPYFRDDNSVIKTYVDKINTENKYNNFNSNMYGGNRKKLKIY